MKKTILTYGFLSGGVAAIMLLFMALYLGNDSDNFKNSAYFGYAGILLSMVFVYTGIRHFRDQVNGGVISFGKAFQIGLFIALISTAFYVIAWMIISNTLMTDFMEQYSAYVLQTLRDSGASAETISQKTAEMEEYKAMYENPLVAAGLTFLEPLPVAIPVTLLSAAILRRR